MQILGTDVLIGVLTSNQISSQELIRDSIRESSGTKLILRSQAEKQQESQVRNQSDFSNRPRNKVTTIPALFITSNSRTENQNSNRKNAVRHEGSLVTEATPTS